MLCVPSLMCIVTIKASYFESTNFYHSLCLYLTLFLFLSLRSQFSVNYLRHKIVIYTSFKVHCGDWRNQFKIQEFPSPFLKATIFASVNLRKRFVMCSLFNVLLLHPKLPSLNPWLYLLFSLSKQHVSRLSELNLRNRFVECTIINCTVVA